MDEEENQPGLGRLALEQSVGERAAVDPAFKARLLAAPHDAIAMVVGRTPPSGLQIEVLQEREDLFILSLRSARPGPPAPYGDSPRMTLERRLHELLVAEPGLRERLLTQPAAVLFTRLGVRLSPGVEVAVVTDMPGEPARAHLVLHYPHDLSSSA